MEYYLAKETVKKYVCARCFGMLVTRKAKDFRELDVICVNALHDECDGTGYVTKQFAARRQAEDLGEYQEVIHNYPELAPPRRKVTEDQILKELGF